jgi:hypothetical protein
MVETPFLFNSAWLIDVGSFVSVASLSPLKKDRPKVSVEVKDDCLGDLLFIF